MKSILIAAAWFLTGVVIGTVLPPEYMNSYLLVFVIVWLVVMVMINTGRAKR